MSTSCFSPQIRHFDAGRGYLMVVLQFRQVLVGIRGSGGCGVLRYVVNSVPPHGWVEARPWIGCRPGFHRARSHRVHSFLWVVLCAPRESVSDTQQGTPSGNVCRGDREHSRQTLTGVSFAVERIGFASAGRRRMVGVPLNRCDTRALAQPQNSGDLGGHRETWIRAGACSRLRGRGTSPLHPAGWG